MAVPHASQPSIKAWSVQTLELLNIAPFLHGDEDARLEFARSLASSLRTFGMAKLRTDQLPGCKVQTLFDMSRQFFNLDTESKMTAAMPVNGIPHRGYSFLGQENISGITGFADSLSGGLPLVDVKETFDLGSPEDSEAANRWPRPSALPKFRRVLEEQYVALEGVHEMILEALALALDIPSDTFTSLCGKSHHELRLLHYPSTTARNLKSGQTRIADHTDFGAVTLLFQDSTGGLEGRHPDSAEYRAVQSNQEECLVMLGDCFQRWTGAYFWALPHRVTLPFRSRVDDDEAILAERYSIAFFGKPDRSSKVGNLEDLRIQQQVHYESITAGEYNLMKVRKTYK